MVIIGLGSNVGDRLAHFRKAMQHIRLITHTLIQQVSPVYLSDALLPDNAPPEWDMPHLNLAIRLETRLTPLELLTALKQIEARIGRKTEVKHWGPRIIDIDLLAFDDIVLTSNELCLPHKGLAERPFALWPLADVAPFWRFPLEGPHHGKTAAEMVEKWGSRFNGQAPLHTRQIYQRVDVPALVGILNVTPNSFSDGGAWLDSDAALNHALQLVAQGAEVLDIGAESTAPGANPLDSETEWQRLEPVLARIKEAKDAFLLPPKISIDTRHAQTARKVMDYGVDWINDVTGLTNPAMVELIASQAMDCVMMHHLGIPPSREAVLPREADPVKLVYDWSARQLEHLAARGIDLKRIIFDPGIGFGKTPEQSFQLLKSIAVFKNLGTRLLVGHSRKSFLSFFTPYPASDRDIETLPLSLYLAQQPLDYLRIHQVENCARALRLACALISK